MSNLQQTIRKNKVSIKRSETNLAKGREILAQFQGPKKVFTPYLIDSRVEGKLTIYFTDQFEKEYTDCVPFKTIYAFIERFYSNVIDRQINGEHAQQIDDTTPADYFEENKDEALKDYLNNR